MDGWKTPNGNKRTIVAAGGGEEGRPPPPSQGKAFEGRKFGIYAFALQCVSVSLYLFFNLFSALRMGVGGWRGRHNGPLHRAEKPSNLQCNTENPIDSSI